MLIFVFLFLYFHCLPIEAWLGSGLEFEIRLLVALVNILIFLFSLICN